MKILFLHPADDPEKGPWANHSWDRIVDAGLGGIQTYERWRQKCRCPVSPLTAMQKGIDDLRQVRALFDAGCGRLLDEYGLDWWEIMSILLTEEMQRLILLQRFARTLSSADEVHVSRPGHHASMMQALLPGRVSIFPSRRESREGGFSHYLRVAKRLSAQQLIDVFWDKYDAGYQLRGRIARKRGPSSRPVVLLPTAYINVSRTAVAYANTFTQENFLLVATRRSGWLQDLPQNVAPAWLSSYASIKNRSSDMTDLDRRWRALRNQLKAAPEFEILDRLGHLDCLNRYFRHGLEVRDAWRNVLDTEPVEALLCADDSNPFTRIPLLLAKQRGLPNISCHHGALDGRQVLKRIHGDHVWAKGAMEEDYSIRVCGVPRESVEIAAPALPANWKANPVSNSDSFRPYILFLSEACDVFGGRAEEFYRDVLPALADLARASGRELIVKLHAAESETERTAMVDRVLSGELRAVARIVSGPLTENILANTWFGITILSTAAFECAVRGIPCFLCKWLEFSPHGYVEQFIRFGVASGLNHPDEIKKIPQYLQQDSAAKETNPIKNNLWRPASPQRLREIVAAPQKSCPIAS